jgi:subtilisin-like proprotein convertase family protein
MITMKAQSTIKAWIIFLLGAAALTGPQLHAGKGSWDLSAKKVDMHLYLTKTNSTDYLRSAPADNATMSYWFNEASKKMWNATEGNLRIGTIYVYNQTKTGKEQADIHFVEGVEYAWAHLDRLGVNGARMEFGMSYSGNRFVVPQRFIQNSLVHEFGHYGFGVYDEYLGHIRQVTNSRPSNAYYPNPEPGAAGANYWGWNGGGDAASTAGRLFYSAWSLTNTARNDAKWTASLMNLDFADNCTEFSWDGDYPYTLTSTNPADPRGHLKILSNDIRSSTTGKVLLKAGSWWITTMQEEKHRESCWATIAKKLGIPNRTTPPSTVMPSGFTDINWVVVKEGLSLVLCIDRSGSMSGFPLEQAKAGAKLFANLAQLKTTNAPGDYLGLVAYDSFATVPAAIRELENEASRQPILSAIDSLTDRGATSIGAGLSSSRNEIVSVSPTDPLAGETIILLSDGDENTSPFVRDVLPGVVSRGIKVHTISLGSGANLTLMRSVADATKGQHFVVSSPADLQAAYLAIAQASQEANTLSSLQGAVVPGGELSREVRLNEGMGEAVFVLTSDSPGLALRLRSPTGEVYDETSTGGDVESISSDNNRIFTARNPRAGVWTAFVSSGPATNTISLSKSENPPAAIPDGRGLVKRTLNFTNTDLITSVFPSLAVKHPYVGDLKATLQGPDKTTVVLQDRSGTGKDLRGTYGKAGELVSEEPLSAFIGKSIKGKWTLTVQDQASGDAGVLENWALAFNDSAANIKPVAGFDLVASAKDPRISVVATVAKDAVSYPERAVFYADVSANGPVSGADVAAVITHPDGETQSVIPLRDNGNPSNADDRPGDGTYSGFFEDFSANGQYQALITVDCSKGFIDVAGNAYQEEPVDPVPVPAFVREEALQFQASGVPTDLGLANAVQVKNLAMGRDSSGVGKLALQGSFNADIAQYQPKKDGLILRLDGYSLSLGASDLKQKGRNFEYSLKTRGSKRSLRVKITPFVGGTSKCVYAVTANGENLGRITVTEADPEIDFSLDAGATIGDGATLLTTTTQSDRGVTSSYKALANGEKAAALYIQTAGVKISKKRPNRDSFQMLAGIPGWTLPTDLSGQAVSVSLGGIVYNFPAGSLSQQRDGSYQAVLDGKNITLRISPEKRTLQLVAKNQQIGAVASPAVLSVDIGGQLQVARLLMSQNSKTGTYSY